MMRMIKLMFGLFWVCVFLAGDAFAPIHGVFPSSEEINRHIESLIQRSDAIVVVRIERREQFLPGMMYNAYEVVIEKSLKGDIPAGSRQRLGLWSLPYADSSWDPFHYGSSHMIFLIKLHQPSLNVDYCNINDVGSHLECMWFSPYRATPDPDPLSPGNFEPLVTAYKNDRAWIPFYIWLLAGIIGIVCAVVVRFFIVGGRCWKSIVIGFCLGVIGYGVGLGLYARDVTTLESAWIFLGQTFLFCFVCGVPLAAVAVSLVWLVRCWRRRSKQTSPGVDTR